MTSDNDNDNDNDITQNHRHRDNNHACGCGFLITVVFYWNFNLHTHDSRFEKKFSLFFYIPFLTSIVVCYNKKKSNQHKKFSLQQQKGFFTKTKKNNK